MRHVMALRVSRWHLALAIALSVHASGSVNNNTDYSGNGTSFVRYVLMMDSTLPAKPPHVARRSTRRSSTAFLYIGIKPGNQSLCFYAGGWCSVAEIVSGVERKRNSPPR